MATKNSILEQLKDYSNKVRSDFISNGSINEENTKSRYVSYLLRILEWDTESKEVDYEKYFTEKGRADIALVPDGQLKAIIEVKSFNKELESRHAKQSMRCSKGSTRWALVTNGRELRLYDIKHRKNRPRLFFSINFMDFDKLKERAYFDILMLLSRKKIVSRLDEVAKEFRRMEKEIKAKTREMKDGVVKDFLKLSMASAEARISLIHQAIRATRKSSRKKERLS